MTVQSWTEMLQPHPHFATVGHIFEALLGAQIMYTISRFKSWEVRIPELQTVLNLELKRRSYCRLKMTVQSWTKMLQPQPILLLFDTFLEHFLELKLCILYLVSNLGKSRVQSFRRCSIWSWNEEVMVVRRRLCKQWVEMSQLHPHFTTVGHIVEALIGAQIMHTISRFKAQEVESPAFQTVYDLELKRRSYGRLKMTVQTMSWNVTAIPPFSYCWTHFWSTSLSSNYV